MGERVRLPFIDGLRGLAILMVLLYHCSFVTAKLPLPTPLGSWSINITAPLQYGYLGVHLFFVFSGFCLMRPLLQGSDTPTRLNVGRFWRRRAGRILPPYYTALALFGMRPCLERAVRSNLGWNPGAVHGYQAGSVLSHVFMLHNLFPAWSLDINAAYWTLALEWQFYLLFPLLVVGFRRWGPTQALAVILTATLVYRIWTYTHGYLFFTTALPGRLSQVRTRNGSRVLAWAQPWRNVRTLQANVLGRRWSIRCPGFRRERPVDINLARR